MARSRLSYQAALFRRMSVAELPLLISLALAFVTYGGFYLVLFGAAVTLNLLVVHVWPTERSVDRTAASLELGGARSHLREALGLDPLTSAPPTAHLRCRASRRAQLRARRGAEKKVHRYESASPAAPPVGPEPADR